MCALGKPAFAYTNDARGHFERTAEHYDGKIVRDASGRPRGPDGFAVEDFDMIDNLMMHGGVESRGGVVVVGNAAVDALYTDMTAFRQVLEIAAKALLKG